ncbi:MAG: OB-fold nucleic acid binding domain-containing protein [Methanomicrobiales archaeon]|nr:OB-fold nucleic acid binding domain-containing protein [Methanomicrobiales archaeon]
MAQEDRNDPEPVASGPVETSDSLPNVPHDSHPSEVSRKIPRPRLSIVAGWDRQERVALFLLVAVTIAVLTGHLVLGSVGKGPFAHPYSNASRDGELVLFQGIVERVTHTQTGGHLILEVEGFSVFVPAAAARGHAFRIGDTISLYGTVQTYRGEREIVVQDGTDIWIDP